MKIANFVLSIVSSVLLFFSTILPGEGVLIAAFIFIATGDYGDDRITAGSLALLLLYLLLLVISFVILVTGIVMYARRNKASNTAYTVAQSITSGISLLSHIASIIGTMIIINFMDFDVSSIVLTIPAALGIAVSVAWLVCTSINGFKSRKSAA